jgi:predicted HD phosphohydrolase
MSTKTRATYRTMAEGTAEDYALIEAAEDANNAALVTRVLGLVEALADGEQAYPISRLDHSLQSATRAFDDQRPVEYVVAALLYYYAPHMGGVRDARERYRGHQWFDDCVEFCEKYDQNCFDIDFEHRPLEFFKPMVEHVFAREPWTVTN